MGLIEYIQDKLAEWQEQARIRKEQRAELQAKYREALHQAKLAEISNKAKRDAKAYYKPAPKAPSGTGSKISGFGGLSVDMGQVMGEEPKRSKKRPNDPFNGML